MSRNIFLITILDDLFTSSIILLQVFGTIFLYEIFDGIIILTFLPLIIIHMIQGLLVPWFGKLVGSIGTRKSLYIAIIIYSISNIPLYFFSETHELILLGSWIFLYTLAKLFFHLPYIYIVGQCTSHNQRGSILRFKRMSLILVGVIVPLLGGLISDSYGLSGLSVVSTFLFILCIIPAFMISDFYFEVDLKLKNVLWLVRKKYQMILNNVFYRISLSSEAFWPIFVFIVLGYSFTELGMLLALVAFLSTILVYFAGQILDKMNRAKYIHRTAALVASGWLLRALSINYFGLVFADIIFNLSKSIHDAGFEVINYDGINDGVRNKYRDEVSIIEETVVNITISLSLLILAIIATMIGIQAAFLFAALAVLSLIYVN